MPNLPWMKKEEVGLKKSADKLPEGKPAGKASPMAPVKSPTKTAVKSVAKGNSPAKPTAKPAAKPASKPASKPAAKPVTKSKPAPAKPIATKIAETSSPKLHNEPKNAVNLKTRLFLAKAYKQKFDLDESDQTVKDLAIKAYEKALEKLPKNTEASIDLARLITATDSMKAVDLYCSCDESLITAR